VDVPEDDNLEETEQFRKWLADFDAPDTAVREFAASALYDIAIYCHLDGKQIPPVMIPPLVDALRDPEGCVRGKAARALGGVGMPDARHALPRLIELLADDEEEDGARAEFAYAVAQLGGVREAAPVLVRLLRDGSDVVREAAGAALERDDLSGLGVESQLRACLADESPLVRTWVCWSLWRLTKEAGEFIPLLLAAMRNERARMDAARLLCLMKEQAVAALPQLLALRDDPNWGVRLQAVRATINIPCSDELALPLLESLRADPHEVVRMYVVDELKKRGRAEQAAAHDPARG
jgi:HEAT repeat protein